MPDTTSTTERLLTMLADAPSHLAGVTEGLLPAQLVTAPQPDEWSARDVLAHLRACADVWGKAIEQILSEDRPVIKAINPRTWIKQTNYLDQEFRPSLQAFGAQRAELLALLQRLGPEEWSRTATVIGAGKRLERTVYSYAEWLANYERSHIKQIERIVDQVRK